jgi:hypothetical protein
VSSNRCGCTKRKSGKTWSASTGRGSSDQYPVISCQPGFSIPGLLTLPLTSIKVSQQTFFCRRDVYNWRLT